MHTGGCCGQLGVSCEHRVAMVTAYPQGVAQATCPQPKLGSDS